MSNIQRIVVAGILIHNNRALIVRRSPNEEILPGIWELPSGKVEFGENPSLALKREFLEETGLTVDIIFPYDVFDYTVERNNNLRHTVQINFLVAATSQIEVKLSKAHSEFQWLALEEINSPFIDDVLRKILENGWTIHNTQVGKK